MKWSSLFLALLAALGTATVAQSEDEPPTREALRSGYAARVRPLLETYCIDCHDQDTTSKLRLDLLNPDIAPNTIEDWTRVKNLLDVGSMPPKGKRKPTASESGELLAWIAGSLARYDAEHREKQIADLRRELNAADRQKLEEVVTAVRGVEADIQRDELWLGQEKPKAPFERPIETITATSSEHARSMFDLVHAAFVTDSTRVVTYQMPSSYTEVSAIDKHQLNHDLTPQAAGDSIKVDQAMSEQLARFIGKLSASQESDGKPLFHHTLAAYGAAVWGANHSLRCLPIMLLGRGGGRVAQGMTRTYEEDTPLANLWLTMLTAAGAADPGGAFADSTGTLAGLL